MTASFQILYQPFFSIAREQCIGWVTAKHSNHFGVGAYVSIQKQLVLKVICISIFKVLCRTNCKRGTDRNHFNKYTTCPNSAWSKGVRTWNESNHICRTVNKHIFTQIQMDASGIESGNFEHSFNATFTPTESKLYFTHFAQINFLQIISNNSHANRHSRPIFGLSTVSLLLPLHNNQWGILSFSLEDEVV